LRNPPRLQLPHLRQESEQQGVTADYAQPPSRTTAATPRRKASEAWYTTAQAQLPQAQIENTYMPCAGLNSHRQRFDDNFKSATSGTNEALTARID
jgi:hypothetical protein